MEGLSPGRRVFQQSKGLVSVGSGGTLEAPLKRVLLQDSSVGGIVIHNTQPSSREGPSWHGWRLSLCRLLSQPHRKPEGASLTGYTLNSDLPPHLFRKLLANGEAQAGTAKLPRGRGIRLGKRLEQSPLYLGGYSDSRVDYGKFDQAAL